MKIKQEDSLVIIEPETKEEAFLIGVIITKHKDWTAVEFQNGSLRRLEIESDKLLLILSAK